MDVIVIVAVALAGLALFVFSLSLRARTGGKYEIRTIDLMLLLIPVSLWLIGTGRIQKIAFGGLELETAEAFVTASEAAIDSQVTRTSPLLIDDVVEVVERGSKEGVERIPELIEKKTEALEFRLKHGGYWGPAIQEYFESLSAHAYLRYAIIHHADGTLFGVFDARELLRYFQAQKRAAYKNFARYLNAGDQESLAQLPGFTHVDDAVTANSNKRIVLEKMDNLDAETLPVVDDERRFVGMVDRARLTASLIVDVAKRLEQVK